MESALPPVIFCCNMGGNLSKWRLLFFSNKIGVLLPLVVLQAPEWIGHHHSDQGNNESLLRVNDKGSNGLHRRQQQWEVWFRFVLPIWMLVVMCLQLKLIHDVVNYILKKDMANQIVYTKTLMPYYGDATGKEFLFIRTRVVFGGTVDNIMWHSLG